ncbi:hypothetical protein L3Q82_011512, partial [Scortum barcoo]
MRILFTDYSLTFNTIVPSKLVTKLRDLGLDSEHPVGRRTPGFADGQHHNLHSDSQHWRPPVSSALSCTPCSRLITGDDETAYLEGEEVRALTSCCQDNNLKLNISKSKELMVDFRKRQREEHAPLSTTRPTVERVVSSFRFLRVHISEDLTWTHHTDFITKTSRQWLFFLCRLWRFNMNLRILCSFYRCTIERILTGCITTWYGNCTPSTIRLYRG